MSVNYALYLVTDSTAPILKGRDLVGIVDAAILGGVTVVQYRDKHSDTVELILMAKKLHAVTKKYGVPLLINDRIDVALAIGADGVHIGQDDTDLVTARKLLGEKAIIGVSVSSIKEAQRAAKDGADYLGIGTMFSTLTKEDTKAIIGTSGTRDILGSLSAMDEKVVCVAIGGINASNIQRVMYQSKSTFKGLDGVAIVSAVIGAEDPKKAAADLKKRLEEPPAFAKASTGVEMVKGVQNILDVVPSVIKNLQEKTPLSHNMTNFVVQNFAANVALAIGASPIMAGYGAEAPDLSKLGGSLVVNMGSVDPAGLKNYKQAIQAYNEQGGPILFDPVGAGATSVRREAVKTLMGAGYFDVIKGNEGEIKTVAGEIVQQKGVDSGTSTLDADGRARLVKKLAARERCVILLTGEIDYVSDGKRTLAISNGHYYLGKITGAGCTLGTTIASCLAVYPQDKLIATVAGLLLFELSAEYAARSTTVLGPGTFIPAFIDALYLKSEMARLGDERWMEGALVKEVFI